MNIIKRTNVTEKERQQLLAITRDCHQLDGSYRTPYLDTTYNVDKDMPAFFLAYEATELVGYLSVYADEPKTADVSLYVLPAYRRKGIARALLSEFANVATQYNLSEVDYVTETAFLTKHPNFLEHFQFHITDVELWLEQPRRQFALEKRVGLEVVLADLDLVEEIATFQAEAFGNPLESSRTYAREAILDDNTLLFVLKKDGQIVASCSVDMSTDFNFFFGLAVKKELQGQGLGSYLMSAIMNDVYERNDLKFQIVVDKENTGAYKLYQRLGFQVMTEVVYVGK